MAEEAYDRGGGRSGASERLGYAFASVSGLLDPRRTRPTIACWDTRYAVPQPAIEIQPIRQSLPCCVGDCEDDFPQSESPDGCSIGRSVANAGATTES